jgi:hypothetical protein
LFAVSSDGELVIIEVKSDAPDEKARREAMEFQGNRYAAASRRMTAQAIIEMLADYLRSQTDSTDSEKVGLQPDYLTQAVLMLCRHLVDEDEELTEAVLENELDPKPKQKTYLVAARYEPDVLSACAWLREHEIDIACFRLRPYRISERLVLERERLIPPPELEEFLVEMQPSGDGRTPKPPRLIARRKSDKPTLMRWTDETEVEQAVLTWKDALVEGTKRAISLGLPQNELPMKQSTDGAGLISPRDIQRGLYIETNASSVLIEQLLSQMLQAIGKSKGFLQIITRSGRTINLPME